MTNSAHGKKLFSVFRKDDLLMKLMLQIMQMPIHPMPMKAQVIEWLKLLNGSKYVLVKCLHGLKIPEWKLRQKNSNFLLVLKLPAVWSKNHLVLLLIISLHLKVIYATYWKTLPVKSLIQLQELHLPWFKRKENNHESLY